MVAVRVLTTLQAVVKLFRWTDYRNTAHSPCKTVLSLGCSYDHDFRFRIILHFPVHQLKGDTGWQRSQRPNRCFSTSRPVRRGGWNKLAVAECCNCIHLTLSLKVGSQAARPSLAGVPREHIDFLYPIGWFHACRQPFTARGANSKIVPPRLPSRIR